MKRLATASEMLFQHRLAQEFGLREVIDFSEGPDNQPDPRPQHKRLLPNSPSIKPEDLLSTKQIANMLGVTVPTVSNWRRRPSVGFPQGRLTTLPNGQQSGRPHFLWSEVEDWVSWRRPALKEVWDANVKRWREGDKAFQRYDPRDRVYPRGQTRTDYPSMSDGIKAPPNPAGSKAQTYDERSAPTNYSPAGRTPNFYPLPEDEYEAEENTQMLLRDFLRGQ